MQAPGLRRLVSTTVRAVQGRLRRSTLAARRQDRRLDGCHLGPKWPMARVAGTDRARCRSVRIYGEKWVVVAGPCTCVGRSWLGWTRSGEGGLAVCLGLGLRRTLRSRRSVGLLCWVPSRAWVLGFARSTDNAHCRSGTAHTSHRTRIPVQDTPRFAYTTSYKSALQDVHSFGNWNGTRCCAHVVTVVARVVTSDACRPVLPLAPCSVSF